MHGMHSNAPLVMNAEASHSFHVTGIDSAPSFCGRANSHFPLPDSRPSIFLFTGVFP